MADIISILPPEKGEEQERPIVCERCGIDRQSIKTIDLKHYRGGPIRIVMCTHCLFTELGNMIRTLEDTLLDSVPDDDDYEDDENT